MKGLVAAVAAGLLLTGCAAGNLRNIGGKLVAEPPSRNFRGQPVVQVTFVIAVDPAAEDVFLDDYTNLSVTHLVDGKVCDGTVGDDGAPESTCHGVEAAEAQSARLNLNGMMAKNTFYAFQLARYLKMKAAGRFAVILNPVTLKYDVTKGYSYEPFEKQMPPYDVELNFLSYVDPNTQPSNKGGVITTHGESLAPIVSVRVDPRFRPTVDGAVALTGPMIPYATNPDGQGLRAQLIDYFNARKRGTAPSAKLSEYAVDSGPSLPGTFFSLDLGTFDLKREPPPAEVLPVATRVAWNYNPGSYYAYEFFEGYYRIVMGALQSVDNNRFVTAVQKKYWAYYEPGDLSGVMLGGVDRRKRRFLIRAKQVELKYLQDRDGNWMNGVLEGNGFKLSFNHLRDAEQESRDEYIQARFRQVAGFLLAIAGGVGSAYSSSSDNHGGLVVAGVAIGLGIGLVSDAAAELAQIDEAFVAAFESSYESQKDYVFDTAEGERVAVRARDYADFKTQLKARYDQRFNPGSAPRKGRAQAASPSAVGNGTVP